MFSVVPLFLRECLIVELGVTIDVRLRCGYVLLRTRLFLANLRQAVGGSLYRVVRPGHSRVCLDLFLDLALQHHQLLFGCLQLAQGSLEEGVLG